MDNIQPMIKKTCVDLLTCLYNLKPTDLEVLVTVAKNEDATIDDIAEIVQRDRSSVHRCLAKLVTASLVTKESKSIKGGGYYHTYAMVEPQKIKRHAKERVKEIIENLNGLINSFESDLNKHLKQS
jgi:predicted transcriptional regulator